MTEKSVIARSAFCDVAIPFLKSETASLMLAVTKRMLEGMCPSKVREFLL